MTPFENTTDYTPIADSYDKTRNMPEELLDECFRRIIAATGLGRAGEILDAGCGTGQLSMPLIRSGFRVTGIDVSEAMLKIARAKARPGETAEFIIADVRSMDFASDRFEATMASKLFQHVGHWESAADEMVRVTKDRGLFIHIIDKGAFGNAVRRQFSALTDARGYRNLYKGIRDSCLLAAHLVRGGAEPIAVDTHDLFWRKRVRYGDAVEHLKQRLHSEYWGIPQLNTKPSSKRFKTGSTLTSRL